MNRREFNKGVIGGVMGLLGIGGANVVAAKVGVTPGKGWHVNHRYSVGTVGVKEHDTLTAEKLDKLGRYLTSHSQSYHDQRSVEAWMPYFRDDFLNRHSGNR